MRKLERITALAAVAVAALLAAPVLYARDNHNPTGSMMRDRMMGDGNMMERMSRMMDHCSGMMQSGPRGNRPNDQWRKERPTIPDKNG